MTRARPGVEPSRLFGPQNVAPSDPKVLKKNRRVRLR